jgi:accessory gene regulator protein AgrB
MVIFPSLNTTACHLQLDILAHEFHQLLLNFIVAVVFGNVIEGVAFHGSYAVRNGTVGDEQNNLSERVVFFISIIIVLTNIAVRIKAPIADLCVAAIGAVVAD